MGLMSVSHRTPLTGRFWSSHSASSAYQKCPTGQLSSCLVPPSSMQGGLLTHLSLRIAILRETSEGPATRWFSISPYAARPYLTIDLHVITATDSPSVSSGSSCPGIVPHLRVSNVCAQTPIRHFHKWNAAVSGAPRPRGNGIPNAARPPPGPVLSFRRRALFKTPLTRRTMLDCWSVFQTGSCG
ncbi:hypothetical protein JTE90_027684 [Oedothorax gibbosus]|uniref:Uncharacterized protein n=1 Tax=Oedothorax gibbosus TaxID=931172 RepID=A0AAV6TL51_9ARAC|nr:hypothetical protein JTE90_027684 [Oedothorax gibbosus]